MRPCRKTCDRVVTDPRKSLFLLPPPCLSSTLTFTAVSALPGVAICANICVQTFTATTRLRTTSRKNRPTRRLRSHLPQKRPSRRRSPQWNRRPRRPPPKSRTRMARLLKRRSRTASRPSRRTRHRRHSKFLRTNSPSRPATCRRRVWMAASNGLRVNGLYDLQK